MPVFLSNQVLNTHVKQILKIFISVALVGYCLTLVDIQKVFYVLDGISWIFLVLAFLFTLLGTIVFKALVTWRLLSQQVRIPFSRMLAINLSMRFYTMILPKVVVAGIRWNKYRHISSKELSFVLVSFEALFALTVAAFATLVFIFLDGSAVIPTDVKVLAISLCLLFISLVCLVFIFPNSAKLLELGKCISRYTKLEFCTRLLNNWCQAVTQLQLSNVKTMWPIVALGLSGHLLFLVGGYILFLALSIDIHFFTVAWVRSVVFMLVSVPISFAGIGIRELGFVALFGLYGLDPDGIIAYAILALLVQSVIGLIGMTIEITGWIGNKSGVKFSSWR